jgi:hypothetical protein
MLIFIPFDIHELVNILPAFQTLLALNVESNPRSKFSKFATDLPVEREHMVMRTAERAFPAKMTYLWLELFQVCFLLFLGKLAHSGCGYCTRAAHQAAN